MPSWLEIKKWSVFSPHAVRLPTLSPQSLVFCFTSLTKATLPLALILDLLLFLKIFFLQIIQIQLLYLYNIFLGNR